jgi:hypothetical protein
LLRFVPSAERQRRVAELGTGQRLRRSQLLHARDRAPDAGLAGGRPIDDRDAAHSFAAQQVGDRKAALAAADDDDVVVDACARPNPIGRIAPDPAHGAFGLFFELLRRVGELRCCATRLSIGRGDLGGEPEAADRQCGGAAKEPASVDLARRRCFFFCWLEHVFPRHAAKGAAPYVLDHTSESPLASTSAPWPAPACAARAKLGP